MTSVPQFLRHATLYFLTLAVLGGAIATILYGSRVGVSFALGCGWLALNIVLLGLLILAVSDPQRPRKLLATLLACAKIPLAYILLLWLLSRDFITPAGIIAALAALPVVLVAAGLTAGRRRPADN